MFLEEGFNDFLAKPIEISVLERVLRRNLPEEKLVFQTKEHTTPETTDNLVIGDLDVRQGLLYCGGKQQYLDILKMYYEQATEKLQELETLYDKQNWKDYTIKVHALKSTMRSIGANILSEKAKALEAAGKKEDIGYILENHADMVTEYHRVIKELEECPLIPKNQPEKEADVEQSPASQPEGSSQKENLEELP